VTNRFEGDMLVALAAAVDRRMREAEALRAAGDPMWWKIREAVLLAVGTLNDIILVAGEGEGEGAAWAHTRPLFSSTWAVSDTK
jgi:hypothetical protein